MPTLEEIVKEIQHQKKWRIEDVAKSINYTRPHLSREMKKDNPEIKKMLLDKYSDVLSGLGSVAGGTKLPLTEQMLYDLVWSNKKLVESNSKLVDNTVDLTQMIKLSTGYGNLSNGPVSYAISPEILELVIELGTGKKWRSKEEAFEDVDTRFGGMLSQRRGGDSQEH